MNKLFAMLNLLGGSPRLNLYKIPSWQPDLKVWTRSLEYLNRALIAAVGSLSRSRVTLVCLFVIHLTKIHKHQGKKGVVIRLKTLSVLLMQASPGSRLHPTSRAIGKVGVSVRGSGIPTIIPPFQRKLIRNGDVYTLRLWHTLFGLYRILEIPGILKISTITNPGKDLSEHFCNSIRGFIPVFLRRIPSAPAELPMDPKKQFKGGRVLSNLVLMSSSANASPQQSSFASRVHSAVMWNSRRWGGGLLSFLEAFMDESLLYALGAPYSCLTPQNCCSVWVGKERIAGSRNRDSNGRLATKLEPAGKLRVFAMVDYWTQVALKPLHDYLFFLLKSIPQDGTFDQHKPVRDLIARKTDKTVFYSYDLSAATDRLPVVIQQWVIAGLFGEKFAIRWQSLLVNRDYVLPKEHQTDKVKSVRYAVGQPMGALSSWGMLALSHHLLVQYSACRVGHTVWFADYAILGDDIVIADSKVAAAYLSLMSEIGVEIGLAKSLVASNKCVEFAKVLYVAGQPVSGLPFKLMGASQRSLGVAMQLLRLIHTYGTLKKPSQVAAIFGFSWRQKSLSGTAYKTMSMALRHLLLVATLPAMPLVFSRRSWADWVLQISPTIPAVYTADLAVTHLAKARAWVVESMLLSCEKLKIDATKLKDGLSFLAQATPLGCIEPTLSREWITKANEVIFSLWVFSMALSYESNISYPERTPEEAVEIFENALKASFEMFIPRIGELPTNPSLATRITSDVLTDVDSQFARKWDALHCIEPPKKERRRLSRRVQR